MGKQSPSPVEKGEFFIDTSLLELSHSDLKAYRPRTPADQLKEKMERLRESKVGVGEFLEALPIPAVILEGNRQIVASNRALADLLSQLNIPLNLGLRPGETLRCLYSQECSTGCGTGEKCRLCPAFKAILSAQAGQPSFNRCDLTIKTRQGSKQINVMVSTAPLPSLQPAEYILMTFQDITPQVRRHNLDRIFFHDLLNTNWLISGYVNLMMLNPHKSEPLYVERLHQASQRLVDEIEAQRDLANVQAHELPFNFQSSDLGQLIEEVLNKYHNDPNNTKLNILTRANLPRVTIFTLPQLLRRLLRAACATGKGEKGCEHARAHGYGNSGRDDRHMGGASLGPGLRVPGVGRLGRRREALRRRRSRCCGRRARRGLAVFGTDAPSGNRARIQRRAARGAKAHVLGVLCPATRALHGRSSPAVPDALGGGQRPAIRAVHTALTSSYVCPYST